MLPENSALPTIRSYQSWIANETLEDYSLRYAARSFRRWRPISIANTAIGGISFLALEAIGAAITLSYGFANAVPAIAAVSMFIFVTSFPIAYYSSKYNIDMDLLTRGAGFGYIGSTITSLIYASFTFIFFALEGAIMAQALKIYLNIPLVVGYIISSVVIIPITFMGITMISRLQLVTQPIWVLMLITPFIAIVMKEPEVIHDWVSFVPDSPGAHGFDYLAFGAAVGVLCSLVIQIGEQVDYLRFLPDKTHKNRLSWWAAMISAGPGWVVIGGMKILAGSFLAVLAVNAGLPRATALEPIQMYIQAYGYVFSDPGTILAVATAFVVVSQVKINVTNAYAGSLAWSNFFARATHYHPGRVVWLVFNILISLLLMLLGIFQTLELVLAVYSNIATAWIGAMFADLAILKPLGISPSFIEFKRAHLHNYNPVGCGGMAIASVASIVCFTGVLGPVAQAYSAPISFLTAFLTAIGIGFLTKGRYYLARPPSTVPSERADGAARCEMCAKVYEQNDMAYCTFYARPICSLCCSLEAHCHDACKTPEHIAGDQPGPSIGRFFSNKVAPRTGQRLVKVLGVLLTLAVATGAVFVLTYKIIDLNGGPVSASNGIVLWRVYLAILPLLAVGAWWIVLSQESRELAERDMVMALEKLRETQRELALRERLATIGEIAATVSHELRNPLGTLVSSIDVLRRSISSPDAAARGELDRIQRNVWRCVRIIDDLLDYSRQRPLSLMTVDLDAWVRQQLAEHRPVDGATISLDLDAGVAIPIDDGRLRQALVNLVQNAIHAVEAQPRADGGEITVRTRAETDLVVLSVCDNGCGMTSDVSMRAFEPLFSTRPFGFGLGMSLVKRIVEQHGGEVSIESAPGRGTTVTLHLPRRAEARVVTHD